MHKKIICILVSLIFLLSMSSVIASENIETNTSTQFEDNAIIEDCDISEENEIELVEYYDEPYEEQDTFEFEQLELNTTGIIMSDDDYSCGVASFATVLNNFGINMTLNEAKTALNTNSDGTTMEGIINGAIKYNLTAFGISTDVNNLNENFIVHLDINGTNHWSVVKEVSKDYIILADSNAGNINYTIDDFKKIYTNNSIVISNNLEKKLELTQVKFLNSNETKLINGKGNKIIYRYKKAYKTFRVIKYKNKNRLQWRWVYPKEVWTSYGYYKSYRYYYTTTKYSYSNWYFASKW